MAAKAAALTAAVPIASGTPDAAAMAGHACDRGCFEGFLTRYLEALMTALPYGARWPFVLSQ